MLKKVITDLTDADAEVLEPLLIEDAFCRGSIVMEQFDEPHGMVFVTSGTVRLFGLTVLAKNLCALQLSDMEATEEKPVLLGETSIILEQLQNCTVVASSDVTTLVLPMAEFTKLKETHPEIAYKLIAYIAKITAFRFNQTQETFESKVVGNASNVHVAIALLKKYIGNVRVCTPKMAQKLFRIDSAVLPDDFDKLPV